MCLYIPDNLSLDDVNLSYFPEQKTVKIVVPYTHQQKILAPPFKAGVINHHTCVFVQVHG